MPPFVQEITPDIYQVQLPLPFALRIVNCYLLRGNDGWTLLDTGLNTAEAQEIWLTVLEALQIQFSDFEKIVLTHTHPDHYGMAGWFEERTAVPVYLSPREKKAALEVWQTNDRWDSDALAFYRSCGLPNEMSEKVLQETHNTRRRTMPHPQQMVEIPVGSEIKLGDRIFQAISAPGHSDGQLIFYDPNDKLLLCGDHVLMKITPNISLWPLGDPDPLGQYIQSLHQLVQLKVAIALPGHRAIIDNWQGRIDELLKHHEVRLKGMKTAVTAGSTVYEISQRVFKFERLGIHEKRFAVSETLAHLDYLTRQNHLQQVTKNGHWPYYPN